MSVVRYRRTKRIAVAGTLFLLLFGAVWITAWILAPKPPVEVFDEARVGLSGARGAEAATYAPELYRRAEDAWEHALDTWRGENARFFLSRDYERVRMAALNAVRLSEAARRRAETRRDSLRWTATVQADEVRGRLEVLRDQLRRLPFRSAWGDAASRTQILLVETEGALERSDFLTAASKVERASEVLNRVGAGVQGSVSSYLAQLPQWKRWVDETVSWSERHSATAIVVDKMGQALRLYEKGRLVRSFPIELGPSWMGPKRYEGDESTPEGKYFVRRKRGTGDTVYFRALEINYPNEMDRRRFDEARRHGDVPAGARIGGLIEIHGEGGRGANWTRGCVALKNTDMSYVFGRASVGTPITIVGALELPSFMAEQGAAADRGAQGTLR